MADRPILFSAPMIRALLEGRKTQTRRIIKPQPHQDMALIGLYAPGLTAVFGYDTPDADHKIKLRYVPGDRLWVKEAFRAQHHFDDMSPREIMAEFQDETGDPSFPTFYEANQQCDGASIEMWQQSPPGRLRASMHMPRCASRLTLTVTDVRVQRLQEISEADAIAEGCPGKLGPNPDFPDEWDPSPVEEYRDLWDSINGAGAWDQNPWVAAYTFTVQKRNIDDIRGKA